MAEKTVHFSKLFPADEGNDLNNMPGFHTVEELVILIEMAKEKLAQLDPDSDEALEIERALTALDSSHWSADHDYECANRPAIRKGKII